MMYLSKHVFFLASILFLVVACSGTKPDEANTQGGQSEAAKAKSSTVQIMGKISGAVRQDVYLQRLNANSVDGLDTVKTDDAGNFGFEFEVEGPGYYRVGLSDQNMCVLIVEPKEKIQLNAEASNIYMTYDVKGSEESQRLKDLNALLAKRDSINMAFQQAQMTQNQEQFREVVAVYEGIMAEVVKDVKAFIDEKPASLSSLAATQNLSMDDDLPYFVKVVDALEGIADGNDFYQVMKIQVQQQRKLAIGSPAPEIALPQPNGEQLKLSDLRGQYVLIDFWASWCGPCRKENPNVVRVYNQYHDKGFEILGVSLDKNQKAWLNAIEQDGLKWKHVSDLKYWNSAVVPEYQVKGIPLTYLVDPDGNIVAKNLRGASLEQKLAEIFDR